jgi:hypothetical protein
MWFINGEQVSKSHGTLKLYVVMPLSNTVKGKAIPVTGHEGP